MGYTALIANQISLHRIVYGLAQPDRRRAIARLGHRERLPTILQVRNQAVGFGPIAKPKLPETCHRYSDSLGKGL